MRAYETETNWLWEPEPVDFRPSIEVIEPADPRETPENAHRLPFGFSRVLATPITTQLDRNTAAIQEAEDKLRWIGVLEAGAALNADFA